MQHIASKYVAFAVAVLILSACGASRETTAPAESPTTEPAAETPSGPAISDAGTYVVAGYHPYWLQDAWRQYDRSLYDEVYFFSVEVDSTGRFADRHGWPDRWFTMQRDLAGSGVRVTPVVTLFSQSAFERLFSSEESSDILLENLISLVRDSPLSGGLQLDFEVYQPVPAAVRTNFTQFVEELRRAMDGVRPNLLLSLYVLAYDQSDVFDEVALASQADYLVVQGYDLHGRTEGKTGPVAALEGWGNRNWSTIVDRFTDLGVPAAKIVMSVPYFGYEWPAVSAEPGARTTGRGSSISYAAVDTSMIPGGIGSAMEAAREHGLERDAVSGSPYYAYQDSTGWRQGWFEDPESLERKYRFVVERGLRGVAVFPPAYGTEELNAPLRQHLDS